MSKQISDPYVVLGVPRDSDEHQVREAFRRLAKRYHPDLHPDAATSERMRRVNRAWSTLSDPARRARYDMDHPRANWPPGGSSRGSADPAWPPGAPAASARAWPPAWAPAASRTADGSAATGWAASGWTARGAAEPPARAEDGGTSGVPMLPIAAIFVIGWLAIAGILGGFLLPVVIGLAVVIAAGWVLDRADRGA
jgi:DnaJ domain